ncbi:MAG: hypothetical protein WD490_11255 [Opitutales bacterium]
MSKSIKLKIVPDTQYEDHTCGLCAASAVYSFYGMDPEDYELRTYLGTDNILPYNFPGRDRIEAWMGGADNFFAGTLPPDMLAVLYWDGFSTRLLTNGYPRYRKRLHDHLQNGNPALAVVYGCLHWVVVTGIDDRGVWIADSLSWEEFGNRRRYRLPHEEFARDEHGLILVSRDEQPGEHLVREMTYPAFAREYARGVAFGAAGLGRNVPRWMGLDRFLSRSTIKGAP